MNKLVIDNVDEFVFQVLMNYEGKTFQNACSDNLDLDSDEGKEELKKAILQYNKRERKFGGIN